MAGNDVQRTMGRLPRFNSNDSYWSVLHYCVGGEVVRSTYGSKTNGRADWVGVRRHQRKLLRCSLYLRFSSVRCSVVWRHNCVVCSSGNKTGTATAAVVATWNLWCRAALSIHL